MTRRVGSYIVKTPCCGALMRAPAYGSINFMAWEHWTDGYDHQSLAPVGHGLRRCLCGRCFLMVDAEEVEFITPAEQLASLGWRQRAGRWCQRLLGGRSALAAAEAEEALAPPRVGKIANTELPNLIESEASDLRIMEIARRLYWRDLNHPAREAYRVFREAHKDDVDKKGNSTTFPEFLPSAEQTQNMAHLVCLLEGRASEQGYQWLEIAELYRELGDMGAAKRALNRVMGDNDRLHFVIDTLVGHGVRGPARFNY
jgi:hypothetical protein